jgi:hypothetical protein
MAVFETGFLHVDILNYIALLAGHHLYKSEVVITGKGKEILRCLT